MRRTRATLLAAGLAGTIALGVTAATALPGTQAKPAPVGEGFTEDRSADLAAQIAPEKPRNVILIIGDGMDDSMITAARNYEHGAGGRFEGLDALPFTGAMTTYGLKAGAGPDYPIAYVSDSAPTASGWSTGKKTIDGRVSQGPSSAANVPGEDYETVLEQFKADGKLVGNITTAEVTDATPAAAGSHINARACQGPTDMAACTAAKKSEGGKGSIAEQLVDNEIDVLMGGGMSRYTQVTDAGPSVLDYAETEHGYGLVEDATELAAVTSLDDGPVLGLFAGGNMTPMYQPLLATAPPGAGGADTTCQPAERGAQPDLTSMTEKSLELLDNPDGFFLQVESAMIDKQEHAIDICGAIGDLTELDRVVQVALDYQAENPDTLVIVTGDHAHSTQIVGDGNGGKYTATVKTADGDPMSVAYSTSTNGSNHTGAQIRVAASGPQASNVTGVIDQTDLYLTMLGRTPSVLPPGEPGQPTPLEPATQVISLDTITRVKLKNAGLPVKVAASGATKVTVTLTSQGRTLATKTLGKQGGQVKLKTGRKTGNKLVIRVVATGPGGTARAATQVRATR